MIIMLLLVPFNCYFSSVTHSSIFFFFLFFVYFVFCFLSTTFLLHSLIDEHMDEQQKVSHEPVCKLSNYLTCKSINSFTGRYSSTSYMGLDKNGDNSRIKYECLSLNVSPDLGERIMISGNRCLIEEVFPEISQTLMDTRSGIAWNHDTNYVIRFPLNGYTQLVSLQVITRLLDAGFIITACSGGGVDVESQFFNYLFARNVR